MASRSSTSGTRPLLPSRVEPPARGPSMLPPAVVLFGSRTVGPFGGARPLLLCLVLLVLICARLVFPDIARASIVGSPRFGILLILLLLVLLLFVILFVGVLLP